MNAWVVMMGAFDILTEAMRWGVYGAIGYSLGEVVFLW